MDYQGHGTKKRESESQIAGIVTRINKIVLQNEEIRRLDEQIADKERILNASTNKIAEVDETLLEIQAQLERLCQERAESEKECQANRAKKQSLQLQVQSSNDMDDVSKSDTYKTCDTFHSDFSSPTITEGQQSPLSNCSCEVGDYTDDTRKDDFSGSSEDASRTCTAGTSSGSGSTSIVQHMSDSGVGLDSRNQARLQNRDVGNYTHNMRISDEETCSCSSGENSRNTGMKRSYCPLHAMRCKIAAQKALIMKNLESDVNKAELDEQIADLQDLQRSYIQLEQEMLQSVQDLEAHALCCAEDRASQMTTSIMRCSAMSPTSMEDSNSQIYSPSMTRSCPSMREYRK